MKLADWIWNNCSRNWQYLPLPLRIWVVHNRDRTEEKKELAEILNPNWFIK